MRQSSVRALAISTSCCWEIDSLPAGSRGSMSAKGAKTSAARAIRSAPPISLRRDWAVSDMKMFSATEMSAHSAIS